MKEITVITLLTGVLTAVLTALLAMLIVLALGGCNPTKSTDDRNAPSEMTIIDKTDNYKIYKHDKTGVCYFCITNKGKASVCVMLNPDGTPYTGGNTDEKQKR